MESELNAKNGARTFRLLGAEPAGVTKKVALGVGREIRQAYRDLRGARVRLRGMRFIPSTRVDLGHGAFQVMANSIVEVPRARGSGRRPESVDSVVTIDTSGQGQVLMAVKIPALEVRCEGKAGAVGPLKVAEA